MIEAVSFSKSSSSNIHSLSKQYLLQKHYSSRHNCLFLRVLSTPNCLVFQTVRSDNGAYREIVKERKNPSLTLEYVSDIQIFHRQSIVFLSEQVFMDELQTERLIILVVITFRYRGICSRSVACTP